MKVKYKFNSETLSYTRIKAGLNIGFFSTILTQLFAAIVIAVLLFVTTSYLIDSPKERELKRENSLLATQLKSLEKRYGQTSKVLEDLEKRDIYLHQLIFESKPTDNSSELLKFNRLLRFEGYKIYDVVEINTLQIDTLVTTFNAQQALYEEIAVLFNQKKNQLLQIPSIKPIASENITKIGSTFGMRMHPIYKMLKMHEGIDFNAPRGTKVFATADGKVQKIKTGRQHGLHVVISHGGGYSTLYAHLAETKVREGQKLKKGDVIGLVGVSGTVITPQLHYEVHKNNKPLNPINYFFAEFTPAQYAELMRTAQYSN